MGNNFQSLQYFLPELILIFTILFVIIADLIPSIKQHSYNLTLLGMILVGLMMFIVGPGDNKLIFENMLIDDFPVVFGEGAEREFINFFNQLENNNFPKKRIKNFYYFQIGRWDLQLLNGQTIKFPPNKTIEAIQQSVELLIREDFKNYNIVDLRIQGKIVVK